MKNKNKEEIKTNQIKKSSINSFVEGLRNLFTIKPNTNLIRTGLKKEMKQRPVIFIVKSLLFVFFTFKLTQIHQYLNMYSTNVLYESDHKINNTTKNIKDLNQNEVADLIDNIVESYNSRKRV